MTTLLDPPQTPAVPAKGQTGGWRPSMRVARRELRRAPGRTLVVLLMVLLPVTAVVALDTLLRTGDISVVESLPRDLGDAQARIDAMHEGGPVQQTPDGSAVAGGGSLGPPLTEQSLRDVLPPGVRLLPVRESPQQVAVSGPSGAVSATLLGVDLRDPGTRGPYTLEAGDAPVDATEVAVTRRLADAGLPPGSTLVLPDGQQRTVTGVVRHPRNYGTPEAVVGLPAAVTLQDREPSRYYAFGPDITWPDVQQVNALGATVVSRAVLADPPGEDQVPELGGSQQATTAAIIGLIAVMAVLEVVLLAGPAFAVGARRQRRALALMAAAGAEPRHLRRVVLAQGLVVGVAAGALGAPLGIAIAAAARSPISRWTDAAWGPFEVSARDVVLISLLGAGTALLAAVVPAHVAARQPVVASLQGRRPAVLRAAPPAAVGLVLLAVGSLMCVASLSQGFPELWIAFSALPTVIGAVLLAPVLLAALGRLAARLPLPLRYALRDADRQRSRTAPAVAAVAATVAAAIALATASASDEADQRRQYAPAGPQGTALVTASGIDGAQSLDWDALARAARKALPGERVRLVRGLPLSQPASSGAYEELAVCASSTSSTAPCRGPVGVGYGASLGSPVLVGPGAVDLVAPLLDEAGAAAARRAVEGGGVAAAGVTAGDVELRRTRTTPGGQGGRESTVVVARTTAQAVPLAGGTAVSPAQVVVSEQVARRLGGARTVALAVGDDLTEQQERDLRDALALGDGTASVLVERGYDSATSTVLLVLALVAGGLVLAGTLAATSLALVEARPDVVTLGRVGAAPRTRRTLAGAYAVVIALSGAVLGLAAGLIPGISAAVALTRTTYSTGLSAAPAAAPSALELVVVPWPIVAALLLALPLAAGAVAAVAARPSADTSRSGT